LLAPQKVLREKGPRPIAYVRHAAYVCHTGSAMPARLRRSLSRLRSTVAQRGESVGQPQCSQAHALRTERFSAGRARSLAVHETVHRDAARYYCLQIQA
jgi:hypothetical protein